MRSHHVELITSDGSGDAILLAALAAVEALAMITRRRGTC